jgi:hypothetical protein
MIQQKTSVHPYSVQAALDARPQSRTIIGTGAQYHKRFGVGCSALVMMSLDADDGR